ncbi:MAG: glycosyltransferase, partial [Ignavibacteriae bacterium]|nr:glycosyltransferase [Ignavibacteriota bacterium]
MKKLLIFSDWYLPGYKAGGPITSIYNLTSLLYNTFEIYIVTSDRDLGDLHAYDNIPLNQWVKREHINVYYVKNSVKAPLVIYAILTEKNYDAIYLNSMWSVKYTLFPLLYLRFSKLKNVVIAPRGMLKSSAIKYKESKKRIFLFLLIKTDLLKSITFHATDEQEKADIKMIFPKNNIQQISNVPSSPIHEIIRTKKVGACNLVFTGRLHPIKGLDILLKAIKNITHNIHLEIIGPIEDKEYELTCKSIINTLNPNATVNFNGSLPYEKIIDIYRKSHVFILPTKGENFGHSIFEALLSGLPVIISDQTPWRDLKQKKVGF